MTQRIGKLFRLPRQVGFMFATNPAFFGGIRPRPHRPISVHAPAQQREENAGH